MDKKLTAPQELYKYLKDLDVQRQLDIKKKLESAQVDSEEKNLAGGDLLLYRIKKILSRAGVN